MIKGTEIISLVQWLKTPPGIYLLAWEQAQLDASVTDIFGFHALQVGLPQLFALRDNRIPNRWVAAGPQFEMDCASECSDLSLRDAPLVTLQCDFEALPFADQSLDLVVLPHTLELAIDPHLALREVERVLRPEGRVVLIGFNPNSLWGVRQRLGHLKRRITLGYKHKLFLPSEGEFIGYRRARDWLKLLSFDIEHTDFGVYCPPLSNAQWLQRFSWLERLGPHCWPMLGALYCTVAVKRVRGMRLIGLARQQRIKLSVTQVATPSAPTAQHKTSALFGILLPDSSKLRSPVLKKIARML
jgi:SAM-dependent methyltransferase